MKYQFIEQNKQEFPVVVICYVLNVSESGFYAWRKRPICQRQREDAQLRTQIREVFTTHHGRYGSPRLHAELRDQGNGFRANEWLDSCEKQTCAPKGNGIVWSLRAESHLILWLLTC